MTKSLKKARWGWNERVGDGIARLALVDRTLKKCLEHDPLKLKKCNLKSLLVTKVASKLMVGKT